MAWARLSYSHPSFVGVVLKFLDFRYVMLANALWCWTQPLRMSFLNIQDIINVCFVFLMSTHIIYHDTKYIVDIKFMW